MPEFLPAHLLEFQVPHHVQSLVFLPASTAEDAVGSGVTKLDQIGQYVILSFSRANCRVKKSPANSFKSKMEHLSVGRVLGRGAVDYLGVTRWIYSLCFLATRCSLCGGFSTQMPKTALGCR